MRTALIALLLTAAPALADPTPGQAASKAALQKLGEFVGEWKGSGSAPQQGRDAIWSETLTVGWKFQGDDAWLELTVTGGRFLKAGTLRFDPAKKVYTLALTTLDDKTMNYDGPLVKGKLVMTAKTSPAGDVSRLSLYTVADGARLLVQSERQSKGRGLFDAQFAVAATKAGESFAGGGKKPECLITGGLGTIAVSYNGKSYAVCCTGCRDEFNSDPKKYADAFEKKK